ncbi:MAG: chorismate synthase [Caulobacter sp.]|nr:chorismate synthase [Caulobacter sp.]
MSHNTFGHLFRVTTWGESHGPALGCVVDGCPPGLRISAEHIQGFLDKRRPGAGKFVTQRQEPDAVRILSGVFEDERTDGLRTTGTPISLMIENTDQRSKDYGEIAHAFRPGHADYPYFAKYGLRDYRGGGRSSARETAARVAAGAVARLVIPGVTIRAALVQIGPHRIDRANWDWAQTEQNPYWSPDAAIVPVWEAHLETIRKAGSSTGAVVEVEAVGVPAGWGAPLYGKLDAELAAALMSINAAKGVEIGEGFASAALTGEENADEMRLGEDGEPLFLSNHAGGVLGGISTGQAVTARVAFKPTSSILTPRRSLNEAGQEVDLRTKGRHDPCVGIRGVPVVEAMTACVLADAFLRHRGQTGGGVFAPG